MSRHKAIHTGKFCLDLEAIMLIMHDSNHMSDLKNIHRDGHWEGRCQSLKGKGWGIVQQVLGFSKGNQYLFVLREQPGHFSNIYSHTVQGVRLGLTHAIYESYHLTTSPLTYQMFS